LSFKINYGRDIVDKVIAKGKVKRKSEGEGDLEKKQNFV